MQIWIMVLFEFTKIGLHAIWLSIKYACGILLILLPIITVLGMSYRVLRGQDLDGKRLKDKTFGDGYGGL